MHFLKINSSCKEGCWLVFQMEKNCAVASFFSVRVCKWNSKNLLTNTKFHGRFSEGGTASVAPYRPGKDGRFIPQRESHPLWNVEKWTKMDLLCVYRWLISTLYHTMGIRIWIVKSVVVYLWKIVLSLVVLDVALWSVYCCPQEKPKIIFLAIAALYVYGVFIIDVEKNRRMPDITHIHGSMTYCVQNQK